jgi:predicted DNA-binding WGR domain protein
MAVSEKRNIPKPLDRVIIRLTQAQQPNHRFYNVSIRNAGFLTSRQNGGIDPRGQLCPMKQCPDQRQAAVASQMLVTLFDDKFHRPHFHPQDVIFLEAN